VDISASFLNKFASINLKAINYLPKSHIQIILSKEMKQGANLLKSGSERISASISSGTIVVKLLIHLRKSFFVF